MDPPAPSPHAGRPRRIPRAMPTLRDYLNTTQELRGRLTALSESL